MRIAINGLGRIGRSILRLLATIRQNEGIEIVSLNDIARPELCAYLLAYDSVFGPFPGTVDHGPEALIINGKSLRLTAFSDPAKLDLSGVDLLIDCTGKATDRGFAERALAAGAQKVLISGPCPNADLTFVLGANDDALNDQRIVSNASCTTNALAPLTRLLDDAFGIETGHMTTIHCYTGSQPTVDAPRGDLVRSRAAALSMIPTTTSASRLTDLVLPHLAGRIEGRALRVPTASVSAVDLTVKTTQNVTFDAVNALFHSAKGPIIGVTDLPLVSSDLRSRPESIIMATDETTVTRGGLLRVFGWYDNEWGFSNRMLDVARLMASRP